MRCISAFVSGHNFTGHDNVIKWKYFLRYWPFVRGIHRSPVNSPHKDQWRGALMLSLICVWTNGWVNNRDAGDLRHHRAHYDVTVMIPQAEWCPGYMYMWEAIRYPKSIHQVSIYDNNDMALTNRTYINSINKINNHFSLVTTRTKSIHCSDFHALLWSMQRN